MRKKKRVQVAFTEQQWKVISALRGTMGETDAEIVRNLVISWIAEKSLAAEAAKKNIREGREVG